MGDDALMDIRHKNGAVAELFVATQLAVRDFSIYWPLITQSRCDLVVEKDGSFAKVQIKKATWSKTGNYQYLQARVIGKNKLTNTPYQSKDVDVFIFTDLERIWIVPFEEIEGFTSVCLDSSNPTYKPRTKYDPRKWLLP